MTRDLKDLKLFLQQKKVVKAEVNMTAHVSDQSGGNVTVSPLFNFSFRVFKHRFCPEGAGLLLVHLVLVGLRRLEALARFLRLLLRLTLTGSST